VTRIAVAQLTGTPGDCAGNRDRSVAAAADAFARGAEVVVLPELIVPGYGWDAASLARDAEALDGETVAAWTAVARATGGLVAGGFAERAGEDLFNTAVLVGPDGVLIHYRKLHLFAGEKETFTPGDRGLPVVETAVGTVGLCVCYDLRFVETLRVLALSGADLVCVPTAWVPGFDDALWDAEGFCPQARTALVQANLDQVAIACASQAGASGGFRFLGSSVIGDARGTCVAGPLPGDGEATAIAEVDLDDVRAARDRGAGIRPRADRRTDVYGIALGNERL
jgi:predicted amidohydrolase